jgi:prolipoprotein diacylglyceryltransferase
VLLWVDGRPHIPGKVFWTYILLYGIARAVIEMWMDYPRVLGPLTLAQAVNILVAVVAAVFLSLLKGVPAGGHSPGGTTGTPRTIAGE